MMPGSTNERLTDFWQKDPRILNSKGNGGQSNTPDPNQSKNHRCGV